MMRKNVKVSNCIKATVIAVLVFFCFTTIGYTQTKDVNILIQELKDKNYNIRNGAESSLAKIGKPAVEPLIAVLKDKEPCVRSRVISLLGKIKDTRAVDPLITALKDTDPDVRRDAVTALGEIKDVRAIGPLIAALKDTNSERTLTVLKNFEIVKTEPALIDALNSYCDKSIAEELLHCGAGVWADAAQDWAEKHGYKIEYGVPYVLHPTFINCIHKGVEVKLVPK